MYILIMYDSSFFILIGFPSGRRTSFQNSKFKILNPAKRDNSSFFILNS